MNHYYYATVKSLEEQFPHEEGYHVVCCSKFKFSDKLNAELRVEITTTTSECIIGMEPMNSKVSN